jgi:hypothetical protein
MLDARDADACDFTFGASALHKGRHPIMNDIKSARHGGLRKFLRIGGPILLAVGGLLALVGIASFFLSFARHSGPPTVFFCAFIGLPLMFAGAVMCMFGFMGTFSRYVAAEQAPVARDTINYMADGTQEAVRTVARVAAQGVSEGMQREQAARAGGASS